MKTVAIMLALVSASIAQAQTIPTARMTDQQLQELKARTAARAAATKALIDKIKEEESKEPPPIVTEPKP